MRKILVLILAVTLFASQSQQYIFTIQLATYSIKDEAKIFYNSLPEKIKKKCHITRIKRYFVFRYDSNEKREELEDELVKIKNMGFSDAFIVKSPVWRVKKSFDWQTNSKRRIKKEIVKRVKRDVKRVKNILNNYKNIDSFSYNRLLYEADKMMQMKNYEGAIKGYEWLLEYSKDKTFILINLFYLYGKTKEWQKAKSYLDYVKNPRELLYAFGVGALESKDPNLLEELGGWLKGDYKGYLWLICAVFLEESERLIESHLYYEEAYKRDSSDPFLLFAYARSWDIMKNYENARKYYEMVLRSSEIDENLKDSVVKRLSRMN